jgi:trk system potassium uptake protein TrkH
MIKKHRSQGHATWYYIGHVLIGMGLTQYIPLITSIIYREWEMMLNFLISSSAAFLLGCAMVLGGRKAERQRLGWGQGMVLAAGSWLLGTLLCALP